MWVKAKCLSKVCKVGSILCAYITTYKPLICHLLEYCGVLEYQYEWYVELLIFLMTEIFEVQLTVPGRWLSPSALLLWDRAAVLLSGLGSSLNGAGLEEGCEGDQRAAAPLLQRKNESVGFLQAGGRSYVVAFQCFKGAYREGEDGVVIREW